MYVFSLTSAHILALIYFVRQQVKKKKKELVLKKVVEAPSNILNKMTGYRTTLVRQINNLPASVYGAYRRCGFSSHISHNLFRNLRYIWDFMLVPLLSLVTDEILTLVVIKLLSFHCLSPAAVS